MSLPKDPKYCNISSLSILIGSFLGVASEQSIRQAAERLGREQSTVSRQISALEEGLGFRLFERSHIGVTLTSQGEQLLPEAENLYTRITTFLDDFRFSQTASKAEQQSAHYRKLELLISDLEETLMLLIKEEGEDRAEAFMEASMHLDKLQAGITNLKSTEPPLPTLKLAGSEGAVNMIFPEVVASYIHQHTVEVDMKTVNSRKRGVDDVRDDETDLLIFPHGPLPHDMHIINTLSFDQVLLIPENHPLAEKNQVRLQELQPHFGSMIHINSENWKTPMLLPSAISSTVAQSGRLTVKTWKAMTNLIRSGGGIGFIPDMDIDIPGTKKLSVVNHQMQPCLPPIKYDVIRRAKVNALKSRLINDLVDEMQHHKGQYEHIEKQATGAIHLAAK